MNVLCFSWELAVTQRSNIKLFSFCLPCGDLPIYIHLCCFYIVTEWCTGCVYLCFYVFTHSSFNISLTYLLTYLLSYLLTYLLTYTHLPAYEDGTVCSETSAYKIQSPGNHPKENIYIYTHLYIRLSIQFHSCNVFISC